MKKMNLQDALAEKRKPSAAPELVREVRPIEPPEPAAPRPDRAGKTNVTGYFPKIVKYELQELALQRSRETGERVTIQELLAEALNELFRKYHRPEVAPTSEGRGGEGR